MADAADIAEQFGRHLNSPIQTWLLGAGVSFSSNIPMMGPLTERVLEVAEKERLSENENSLRIISFIRDDVVEDANIEGFLTHLADFISMAGRSRTNCVSMNGAPVTKEALVSVHLTLLQIMAEIVRWGYRVPICRNNGEVGEEALIGKRGECIVKIDEHQKFIQAIFDSGRAGLETLRTPIEFFTTNYDTLLEDALALHQIDYQDGFSGGGVGFWTIRNYKPRDTTRAIVTKLHGSIDWYRQEEDAAPLFRVRSDDTYPGDGGAVMIYPQATKYLNTQRDPFSKLFQRFRNRLMLGADQVLMICGYSFGDEHINDEIENALAAPRSRLTVVAFSSETDKALPPKLQYWRTRSPWGKQVFVASPRGLYQGTSGPFFPTPCSTRDWWTFAGVTRLFSEGLPPDILEEIQ